MKKAILGVIFMVSAFTGFAKSVDWETFQKVVMDKYPECGFVSYEYYSEYEGDVDAYLSWLENCGQCYGEEE